MAGLPYEMAGPHLVYGFAQQRAKSFINIGNVWSIRTEFACHVVLNGRNGRLDLRLDHTLYEARPGKRGEFIRIFDNVWSITTRLACHMLLDGWNGWTALRTGWTTPCIWLATGNELNP